jgi:type IV secretion system protein VirD4
MRLFFAILALAMGTIVTAYPLAFLITHGGDAGAWPANLANPQDWIGIVNRLDVATIVALYYEMAFGASDSFARGGLMEFWVAAASAVFASSIIATGRSSDQRRQQNGAFGNARWANAAEIAKFSRGIEIGVDRSTGKAVRVLVEGNIVSVAPPRSGKTSSLILPNLAFPEPNAWAGPVVVIDPKGDAYRATRVRREAMGRKVRCLDPLNLVGGTDFFNPLDNIDAKDVLRLQGLARAMLPNSAQSSEASAYFRNRGVDVLVGSLLPTIREGRRDLGEAHALLNDVPAFVAALERYDDGPSRSARQILNNEKGRNDIISTANQALQWLCDERMASAVAKSTFKWSDLSIGDTDLFVVLPADETAEILAPYIRCLLVQLFDSIRKHRPAERIIVMIDEAYVLGRFESLIKALGELPGYGASIWTVWQSRQQIVEAYGASGADVVLSTASVVTLFDVSAVVPDEAERWSKAVGSFTALVSSTSTDPKTGVVSKTESPQAVPLVPASEITRMPLGDSIIFVNSDHYTRHPLKLKKSFVFKDARYKGLIGETRPVGLVR